MSPTTDDEEKANEQNELYKEMENERKRTDRWSNTIIAVFILCVLLTGVLWIVNNYPLPNW